VEPGEANIPAAQVLGQAAAHLNAGRQRQGEVLIRQVLQAEPNNHQALNMLGAVALNNGHAPEAAEIFLLAVQQHGGEAEYHCNLGVALFNTGRADEGEAALKAALDLQPTHAMANFNLGLSDLQAGRFEAARRRLEKATEMLPQDPGVQNALGVAYSKCGDPGKAVGLFRAVLEAQPDNIDARLNLAGALTEMGQADEAIGLYERLIESHPGQARLHFDLGVALSEAGRDLSAMEAYEQALALEPEFVDAHVNLSSLYADRGDQDAALEHAGTACALRPGDVHIMVNQARLLRDAGFGAEAAAVCERILALAPDNAEAMGIHIMVLQNDGRFADARALAADLDAVPVLLALSQDVDYAFDDKEIQRLKAAATDAGAEGARASFALGKIYHGQGEYAAAFDFYQRGNALRDAVYNWSGADEQALFAGLTETFTPAFSKTVAGMGQDSDRPVFIVGIPRSGTTLVEQIVASHPHAAGGGELSDILVMADALGRTSSETAPYPACMAALDAATADRLAARYLERLARVSSSAARVTDKMPDNYLHLGLISRILPKARVIHCRRDPMATCFSIYQQIFSGYHPYAYDLGKLGRRYRNQERLMEHWREVLSLPMLEVAYEDVVADLEAQSRRILEFCGLDWDPGVLDFHATQRTVQTASLWQVRQPIYTSALQGWRAYETFLGGLKEALGA
jgi:tetratricopeptide (TPR) repeat protein